MKVTCTYYNVNAFMMYDTLVMELTCFFTDR